MASEKIADSEFTIKWLEEVIQKETKTNASIADFSYSEIGFGRGYTSQVLIVKLTWDDDYDDLPKSVALKIHSIIIGLLEGYSKYSFQIPSLKQFKKAIEKMTDDHDDKELMDKSPIAIVHKCEVAVYDVFRENPPPGLKVPKSYYGRNMAGDHQGVLVLQDLSSGTGTTVADGLTPGQMMQVVEVLASLHAYSLRNDDWKRDDIAISFETMIDSGMLQPPEETMAKGVPQLIEWNPEVFGPLDDKCLELCKSKEDLLYIYKLNDRMGLPDVFCNGDVHAQNMMFIKGDDGKASDELMALYDWQVCHPGNIGEDFARCFATSIPATIRRNHYMEALQHYYECLTKQLGTKPPYTFDQVVEAYKRCFKSATVFIAHLFPKFSKVPELLGDNPDEKLQELMERCKGMIEDTIAYEEEFNR